jgi:hypothetical protein
MRRMILVLTVSTMMLLAMLLTVPVAAQNFDYDDDYYDDDDDYYDDDGPGEVYCEWYGPYPWWEYWCWYPGYGWEYVFWSY